MPDTMTARLAQITTRNAHPTPCKAMWCDNSGGVTPPDFDVYPPEPGSSVWLTQFELGMRGIVGLDAAGSPRPIFYCQRKGAKYCVTIPNRFWVGTGGSEDLLLLTLEQPPPANPALPSDWFMVPNGPGSPPQPWTLNSLPVLQPGGVIRKGAFVLKFDTALDLRNKTWFLVFPDTTWEARVRILRDDYVNTNPSGFLSRDVAAFVYARLITTPITVPDLTFYTTNMASWPVGGVLKVGHRTYLGDSRSYNMESVITRKPFLHFYGVEDGTIPAAVYGIGLDVGYFQTTNATQTKPRCAYAGNETAALPSGVYLLVV